MEYNGSCASSNEESTDEQFLFSEKLDSQFPESNFNKGMPTKEEGVILDSRGDTCSTSYDNNFSSTGTFVRYKVHIFFAYFMKFCGGILYPKKEKLKKIKRIKKIVVVLTLTDYCSQNLVKMGQIL